MPTIYLTSEDNARLRRLLLLKPYESSSRYRDLAFLRDKLARASIVADPAERPSTIRLRSTFEFFDLQSGETGLRTLCLPDELSAREDGLSVTSRFGAAVIGRSVGDEVRWVTPVGLRRLVIRDVVQPPAPGARHPAIAVLERAS